MGAERREKPKASLKSGVCGAHPRTASALRPAAAGILASVALGVLPGGTAVRRATALEDSSAEPGGKMPPSTAGKMPAATWWRSLDAGGYADIAEPLETCLQSDAS